MPISQRPAIWADIEPGLSIQPTNRGDGLPGVGPALGFWRYILETPFFLSAVLEAAPPIQGHRLIGLASAIFVTPQFADAEVADPQPNITSRIVASLESGRSVLATRNDIARANAGRGNDLVILHNAWRDEILTPEERHQVHTLLAVGFTDILSGFRMRRILAETTSEPVNDFLSRSVEYRVIREFPELRRVIYLMTRESGTVLPGSLGNKIFSYREPGLRLRDSDQTLLLAALNGATDKQLAVELGLSYAAVKARWRSTFSRIAEVAPELVGEENGHQGRGMQKRHQVLAYVRSRPEELRPYRWETNTGEGCVIRAAIG